MKQLANTFIALLIYLTGTASIWGGSNCVNIANGGLQKLQAEATVNATQQCQGKVQQISAWENDIKCDGITTTSAIFSCEE